MQKRAQHHNSLHPSTDLPGVSSRGGGTARWETMDVDDRGPAKFFHGREDVLGAVAHKRARARATGGGTTFLIQGAPGAGKTALLHRCAAEAATDGWLVARLEYQALYKPVVLAQNVGEPYVPREERVTTLDAKVIARQTTKEMAGDATVSQVLKAITPNTGLLLTLDEVQNIRDLTQGAHSLDARSTLNAIHNGELGRPVILLAGGLGTSKAAFDALGISRFASGCVVNLERLSDAAERAVIRDWLVEDGGAKGDVTPWIDAITSETHGWPQHIMCFAQPAAHVLHEQRGIMTAADLTAVLQRGRQGKTEYYQGRTDAFDDRELAVLSHLLRQQSWHTELQKSTIMEALTLGRSSAQADELFDRLLHKGVIARTPRAAYAVPVPSMRNWLVDRTQLDVYP